MADTQIIRKDDNDHMHRFAEIHKSLEEIGFVAEKHHLSVEHMVHMVYFVVRPVSTIHLLS